MSLASYLEAVPKVELHVHIEGTVRPATMLALAERNGVELPATTVEGLQELVKLTDWDGFRRAFQMSYPCLQTGDDYEFLTYEYGAELARQNVRYAEITVSLTRKTLPYPVYFGGMQRGRVRVQTDFGVEINWVFCIARNITDPELSRERANHTLESAIAGRENGVVALGLAHLEAGFPPEPFAPWFEQARAAGLHLTPHAGETVGAESVWGAVRSLGAERIGHGVRAIEDLALVEYLADNKIALEICPTSNVLLQVFPDLESHPLRRLHEAGVPITINSDDPAIFGTSMNQEVALLNSAFGLSVTEIDQILLNGVRHSFLPQARKLVLAAQFQADMDNLKAIHL